MNTTNNVDRRVSRAVCRIIKIEFRPARGARRNLAQR